MAAGLQVLDPERFDDVERIGGGNNATVFAAWDRQLERRVALKVAMRDTLIDLLGGQRLAQLGISDGLQQFVDEIAEATSSRYTLLHEARLLARVRHPHVIEVLDVGVLDGSLTLVLPHLGGGTLDEEAIEGPWSTVLELALQIGEGLAAIHAAGLLHRDFKPSNVLFDGHGRPAIADLGLACHIDDAEAMAEWPGTPSYMAPEVLMHSHRDQRDDLYAFCTVVYQMFYGHAPFASPVARMQGRVSQIERAGGLPKAVRAVLVRGLAADPEQRWPDMPTLLAALRRAGRRRSRGWLAVAATAAAAFMLGLTSASSPVRADGCASVHAELDGVWSRALGHELTGALGSAAPSRALDDWASRWLEVRTRECERAEQAEQPMQASVCMAQLQLQFVTTIDVLRRAPSLAGIDYAALIDELPAPESCLDQPDLRPDNGVLALREADTELRALIVSGQLELATERLEQFTALAQEHGSRLDLLLASLRRGQLERRTGDPATAEQTLEFTYEYAVALEDERTAAEAMFELTAIASNAGQSDVVSTRAMVARAMFERIEPSRVPELLELEAIGLLTGDAEQRTRALELLHEALAQHGRERHRYGSAAPLIANANGALARALLHGGYVEPALEASEQGLAQLPHGRDTTRVRELLRLRLEALLSLHAIDQSDVVAEMLLVLAHDTDEFERELELISDVYRRHGLEPTGSSCSWLACDYSPSAHSTVPSGIEQGD